MGIVLIELQQNVNQFEVAKNPKEFKGFNRTTVECKFYSQDNLLFQHRFNRTTVECKFVISIDLGSVGCGFNRTTVECKYIPSKFC